MRTYTIRQKQSNTGSIHDLASDHYDRDIRFRTGEHYAVVRAAYYGGRRGYKCTKTELAACRLARSYGKGYSYEIIDPTGQRYMADYDRLYRADSIRTMTEGTGRMS
jgi:hypothetical protein